MKAHAQLALLLPILLLSASAFAQDDDETDAASAPVESRAERCISLNRVRNMDVVDDSTIVVEMRGGDYFVNNLRRECPGLKRRDSFSYSVSGNQLCLSDSITVLETFNGLPRRGFSCNLGYFAPITKEEADFLKNSNSEERDRNKRSAVTTTSLPPADEDQADSDDTPSAPEEEQGKK